MTDLLWLLVLGAPALAALALLRWPEKAPPWLWLACVPALAFSLAPPPALDLGPLWPGAAWGAEEQINRAWLAFSAVLWGCASRFAVHDVLKGARKRRFWIFWLLAMGGNFLLILAQDVASFYVGFTMMSLSAYGLIIHLAGPGPRQAGRLYVQLAVLGEMLIYAGIMLRVHEAGGTLMLADLQELPTSALAAGLLLAGFGIKAGFWPLHVWLPLAHPAAPAAASAVLSGAMLKAGILGIWQFLPADEPLLQSWAGPALVVGIISMFYGVVLGVIQTKAKSVLAYSSVSQMGYLVAIIALAWQAPQERIALGGLLALYVVHHGLAKGALFMGAGLASHSRLTALHWILALIPALALAGLPLTSGGAVKSVLKGAVDNQHLSLLVPVLTLGSVGTALLVLRALWLMRQSASTSSPASSQLVPWAALCLAPLLLPWLWSDMREALLYSLSPIATWSLSWPIVVAIGLAAFLSLAGVQVPAGLKTLPNPALTLSLRLKKMIQPRAFKAPNDGKPTWRRHERKINKLAHGGTVGLSAWIIGIILLIGAMLAI